jgi:hypothetical protein
VSLLAVHLATNYKAVSCVAMRTLNRQRTNIVVSWFQETGIVLTPKEVSLRERVLETSGILRWGDYAVLGFADVGVPFATVLTSTGHVQELANIFHMQKYLLWPTNVGSGGLRVLICLKTGASANDQLKAWSHALIVAKELATKKGGHDDGGGGGAYSYEKKLGIVRATMDEMDRTFPGFAERLVEMGWDVNTACIETSSGFRISIMNPDDFSPAVGIDDDDSVVEITDPAYVKRKKVV